MNSKEALRTIGNTATKFIKSDGIGRPRIYYSIREMKKKEINIIKQDLDRLEKLEKANKNNEGLVRENTDLINRNFELQDENKALKGNVKILEENKETLLKLFDKAMEENTKLKNAIKILKDKIEFEDLGEMQSGNVYRPYFNDCIDQEEYELLKSVLEEE